jgi:hypothetical protein
LVKVIEKRHLRTRLLEQENKMTALNITDADIGDKLKGKSAIVTGGSSGKFVLLPSHEQN